MPHPLLCVLPHTFRDFFQKARCCSATEQLLQLGQYTASAFQQRCHLSVNCNMMLRERREMKRSVKSYLQKESPDKYRNIGRNRRVISTGQTESQGIVKV